MILPAVAPYVGAWIAAASAVVFALAGWDKSRARAQRTRVPERALLGWALAGGSPGLFLAMLVFRHKTRKAAFFVPFALIVALQLGGAWWLLTRA